MTLNSAAYATGANAIANEITHVQLHSAAPGADYTANATGPRFPVSRAVDAAGKITLTITGTGLPADGPVTHASYWTSLTGTGNRGGTALTGAQAANAAGQYNATLTETPA